MPVTEVPLGSAQELPVNVTRTSNTFLPDARGVAVPAMVQKLFPAVIVPLLLKVTGVYVAADFAVKP